MLCLYRLLFLVESVEAAGKTSLSPFFSPLSHAPEVDTYDLFLVLEHARYRYHTCFSSLHRRPRCQRYGPFKRASCTKKNPRARERTRKHHRIQMGTPADPIDRIVCNGCFACSSPCGCSQPGHAMLKAGTRTCTKIAVL
ncbi:hypothetical protein EJ08DRAFT_213553 [Tothia fuscella]|uniref:Secreted protein n=1 Tax=Tothia fuscella TaxID=1048955 RepID=A0A9P4TZ03_9PEZI|nr:hypothetical protein EJ08DRAFT_213553 [Tothia fuscella]